MLPKLWEDVRPVPRDTEHSIGQLTRFVRDKVPAEVWLEEFGDAAPRNLVQRPDQYYHLHLHEYRQLSHHVRNIVTWENQWPIVCWPTVSGVRFLYVMVFIVLLLVFARIARSLDCSRREQVRWYRTRRLDALAPNEICESIDHLVDYLDRWEEVAYCSSLSPAGRSRLPSPYPMMPGRGKIVDHTDVVRDWLIDISSLSDRKSWRERLVLSFDAVLAATVPSAFKVLTQVLEF